LPNEHNGSGSNKEEKLRKQFARLREAVAKVSSEQRTAQTRDKEYKDKQLDFTRKTTNATIATTVFNGILALAAIIGGILTVKQIGLLSTSITNNTQQFQIDQRPYIWDNNMRPGVSAEPEQKMWANIAMINYGKSPALRTRIKGKIFFGPNAMAQADGWFAEIGNKPFAEDISDRGTVVPPGIPSPAPPPDAKELAKPIPTGHVRVDPGTFGDGGMFTVMTDNVLKKADVDYVLANEESAIVVSHIEYYDGFGNFYWSNICLSRYKNGNVPHCTRNNEIH